jgi:hypothetical protein
LLEKSYQSKASDAYQAVVDNSFLIK